MPKQILLNNLLTDIPAMAIADDRVDPELVETPRRWDIAGTRRFMVVFGLQSSLFDLLTFAVLILFLKASAGQFRTAWFLESVVSEILILLVIRTRRPFFRSPPGGYLIAAGCLMVVVTTISIMPPFGRVLGFAVISPAYVLALLFILGMYVTTAEWTKGVFFKRHHHGNSRGQDPVKSP